MKQPEEVSLLTIFVSPSDRREQQPLHEAIVLRARERNLASAMVFPAAGSGRLTRSRQSREVRPSSSQSLRIEIIDTAERIQDFLPTLREMIGGGRFTIEQSRQLPPVARARTTTLGE